MPFPHQKIVCVTVLFLLAACAGDTPPDAVPTSTPIPTAPAVARERFLVEQGDVVELLEFSGRWLPRDQVSLAFSEDGEIRSVNARPGDAVNAGDLLADYQIADLEDQLEDNLISLENARLTLETNIESDAESIADLEVQVANARLSLQSTRNNSPWVSLENAERQLETARRQLENAQRAYDDARSRPVVSGGSLENETGNANTASGSVAGSVDGAWESLQSAQESVASAELSLVSAQGDFANWEISVQQQENSLLAAEENLRRAREAGGDINPQDVQAVQQAELAVERTREQIAAGQLTSPIDGVVLEVEIRPGDNAEAFAPVITVGNPEPKEVIANLAFNDTQRLSVGQVGTCQVANQPQTLVQCVVRYIPLTNTAADQTTRVAATLPEATEGQQIQVFMPLQTAEDVLFLPPEAIREFRDRTFVVLETPEGPRQAPVELGLRTPDAVEIISGVELGDVVLGE